MDAIEDSAKRGQYQHQNNSADDQKGLARAGRFWRLRGGGLRGLRRRGLDRRRLRRGDGRLGRDVRLGLWRSRGLA